MPNKRVTFLSRFGSTGRPSGELDRSAVDVKPTFSRTYRIGILSRFVPGASRMRVIGVKGRVKGATTVTITKNEILTALNKPEDFVLAIGLVDGDAVDLRYVRQPFQREPDFGVTSVNYNLAELLNRAEKPA